MAQKLENWALIDAGMPSITLEGLKNAHDGDSRKM